MGDMLDAKDVLARLCKLQEEVWRAMRTGDWDSADCFCGEGGYWGVKDYGGTHAQGYRNSGDALEYIERVVRESLKPLASPPAPPASNDGYGPDRDPEIDRQLASGAILCVLPCSGCGNGYGWGHDEDCLYKQNKIVAPPAPEGA